MLELWQMKINRECTDFKNYKIGMQSMPQSHDFQVGKADRNHKNKNNIDLYLSKINVIQIIKLLLTKEIKLIVLKAPININREKINNLQLISRPGDIKTVRKIIIHEYGIYTKPTGGKLSYYLFFFHLQ